LSCALVQPSRPDAVTVAIVAKRVSTAAERMRFSGSDSNHRFRLNVTVSAPRGARDRELNSHQPPMLKRTPSISYLPVAEIPGHAWPRRQAVTVLRHTRRSRFCASSIARPFGRRDGDSDCLHLPGTQGLGRLSVAT